VTGTPGPERRGDLAEILRALPPRQVLLPAAVLLLAVVAAYVPALSAGFIWDDDDYLTENPLVTQPGGLAAIWAAPRASPQYYPLVFTSFWIEHRLWGLHPFGYHLVNVLLHAGSAVLLWRALLRLRLPGAWWAAAVFALHPVHVESVAWVTERKNVLSLLFYLASLHAFLTWEDLRPRAPGRGRWLLGSWVLFVLALLAKTVACSLPVALLLLRWLRRLRVAAIVPALAPYFAAGLVLGLFTVSQEAPAVAAKAAEFYLSAGERLLIAARAPAFYASKLLWPHPLVFFYPRWQLEPASIASWWPVAIWLAAGAAAWTAARRGLRGPAVALLFFVATLFPALGFFDVFPFRYSFVADHFQYHASLGVIALVACGTAWLAARLDARAPWLFGAAWAEGGPAVVLALLGGLTFVQARDYGSVETLWEATLRRNPAAWNVNVHLGNVYLERGDRLAALEQFRAAAQANPTKAEGRYNTGTTLVNIADAERTQAAEAAARGDAALAERLRRQAAEREVAARADFEAAIRLDPRHARAHLNLGLSLRRDGRDEEAVALYRKALAIDPRYEKAWYNLGNALRERGDLPGAEEAYRNTVRLDVHHARAHNNLGVILADSGRHEDAVASFEACLAADPRHETAPRRLAESLVALGRHEEARTALERALLLNPQDEGLRAVLARLGSETP
jgi:tetratricopeptide (TPR) repeat protein